MSRVQQLLAGARIPEGDQVPPDIVSMTRRPRGRPSVSVPAGDSGRAPERAAGPDTGSDLGRGFAWDPGRDPEERRAENRLAALCETLLTRFATTGFRSFLTDRLPEPVGARLVGCILQLADDEDGARAWWQYAAGAEDDLSPYCLHLQSRKYGDRAAAKWWLDHSQVDRWNQRDVWTRGVHVAFDTDFPDILAVLAGLRPQVDRRTRDALVEALLEFVPDAVAPGHARHPAFDLPVPGPGFADRIRALLSDGPGDRKRSPGPCGGRGDGGGIPDAGSDEADGERHPARPRSEGPGDG